MSKVSFKPGALLNPLPVIMATVGELNGESNIITIAWTGIINSNPPMTYISVKPERYSYDMLIREKNFCINLVTKELAFAADYCGVKSGENTDKWSDMKLEKAPSKIIKSPNIKQSPLSLECEVKDIIKYPSHHMFVAEIVNVNVSEDIVDEKGRICLDEAGLVTYSHGEYFGISQKAIGRFGFSVMKPKTRKRMNRVKREKYRKVSGKKRV